MSTDLIIFILFTVAMFLILRIERRQERRHQPIEEKLNEIYDTLDSKFKIDREY